jgi:hypothetical protein
MDRHGAVRRIRVNEEPDEMAVRQMSSRTAGAATLLICSAGVGLAVFAYSRDAFVLLVWALGAAAVWWAAKKPVQGAANPAPPPLPERGSDEEPQVTMVRDTTHPNRWIVTQESPWVAQEIEKDRDES